MLKQTIIYGAAAEKSPTLFGCFRERIGVRRRLLLAVIGIMLFGSMPLHAQRNTDIGFFAGVPWYLGDLSAYLPAPHSLPPAIGPILRYNFNMRHSLRAHAIVYSLSEINEEFGPGGAEFKSSFVDLGLDFEFNWWPYKTAFRKTRYTPYVSAGIGYSLNYTDESVSHLYLP